MRLFCVICGTLICRGAVGAIYSPSQLDNFRTYMLGKGMIFLLPYVTKIYVSLFLSKKVRLFCSGREAGGGEIRLEDLDTAILTHNYFSWPYHAVLSSGHYIFAASASRAWATAGCCPTGLLPGDRLSSGCKTETNRSSVGTCVYIISSRLRISDSTHVLLAPMHSCLSVYFYL